MDKETDLLAYKNLPLDLDELGVVTEAEAVMPGVYSVVLEKSETGTAVEGYIVLSDADEISETAKKYGKVNSDFPELLVFSEDETGNSQYIIDYEYFRYKILHHLPLPENETIRSIAAVGAELYPDYFGGYPVPFLTPWGCTTRNKIIANGVYWLETEQCRRGLAVAYPKYGDLSEGASTLAEPFDAGQDPSNRELPGYLFFKETDSCVPLFELVFWGCDIQLFCKIDRAALMNAIYQFHPEYAIQHNRNEQAGLNDGIGLFLQIIGNDVERQSFSDRLISMSDQVRTEFINF